MSSKNRSIAGVEGFRKLKLDASTSTGQVVDAFKALITRAQYGDRAAIALLVVAAGSVQQVLESPEASQLLTSLDAVVGRQEPKA